MAKAKTIKTTKKTKNSKIHKLVKAPKPREGAWFVKVRHSYLPASTIGWLLYIPLAVAGILMLVALSKDIYRGTNIGLTLSEFGLGLVFLYAVYTWVAEQKS